MKPKAVKSPDKGESEENVKTVIPATCDPEAGRSHSKARLSYRSGFRRPQVVRSRQGRRWLGIKCWASAFGP